RIVIATGTDAVSGGLLRSSEETAGVDATVPVDVFLAGSPPSPFGIINALLIAVGKLADGGKGRGERPIWRGPDPARGGRGRGLPRLYAGWTAVPDRRGRSRLPGGNRRVRADRAAGHAERGRLARRPDPRAAGGRAGRRPAVRPVPGHGVRRGAAALGRVRQLGP